MLVRMHDIVIVGAGSAGCVLAARLTEDPATSVLLLEAGPVDRKLEVKIPAAFSRLYRTSLDWGYHPIGTCRMGTDKLAVVDPELRVRGIDGLRAVDASVLPRLPRGHTNWPTVMVAERASDLIRSDRR